MAAVDGVSLRIAAGEALAVMGPSGSGKSTLLNLIAGLDRPTSGEVRVGGERVDKLSETGLARFRRSQVGMIFQFFNLLDDMTVADNVLLPAQLAGMRPAKARARRRRAAGRAADRQARGRLPGPAVRRGAAAGRDRAGAGQPAGAAARRRADRGAGHRDRGGDRRAAARPQLLGQTLILVTHNPELAARYARPRHPDRRRPGRQRRAVARTATDRDDRDAGRPGRARRARRADASRRS